MKTEKRFGISLTFLLLVGALVSAPVAAATKIKKCKTITVPGAYVVSKNLVAKSGQDCLVIAADFVTLDLGGHVVSGDWSSDGITDQGIERPETTIFNGVVKDFKTGVNFVSKGVSVHFIKAIGNGPPPLAEGEVSVAVPHSSGALFAGIRLGDASMVTNSSARFNALTGIFAGNGSTISTSVVTSTQSIILVASAGIAAETGGDGISCGRGCKIKDNVTRENSGDGIKTSMNSSVVSNVAELNAGNGITVDTDDVAAADAGSGILNENVTTRNTGIGMAVQCGDNASLVDNIATANGDVDLETRGDDSKCVKTNHVAVSSRNIP